MSKRHLDIKYQYLILLSGPEPQRSLLEHKLLNAFKDFSKPVLLVRGLIDDHDILISKNPELTIVNYLLGQELEDAINQSTCVICRSGYSSLLDLANLKKKAFFIPTPGQPEQEYLATRMMRKGLAPFSSQQSFNLKLLKEVDKFAGMSCSEFRCDFESLFGFFQSK